MASTPVINEADNRTWHNIFRRTLYRIDRPLCTTPCVRFLKLYSSLTLMRLTGARQLGVGSFRGNLGRGVLRRPIKPLPLGEALPRAAFWSDTDRFYCFLPRRFPPAFAAFAAAACWSLSSPPSSSPASSDTISFTPL